MRTLIVYYSKTGKTELVAKEIARVLNGEIRKVEEIKKGGSFSDFISVVLSAKKKNAVK